MIIPSRRALTLGAIGLGTAATIGTAVGIVVSTTGGPSPVNPPGARAGATTPATRSAADQTDPRPVTQPVSVPALHHLTPPDAVVRLKRAASPGQLHRLRGMTGIDQVAALDRGSITLHVGGHHVQLSAAGVPMQSIRGFTPQVTAVSLPLWRSIASGELTVGFASERALGHQALGRTVGASVGGKPKPAVRIGAFATLGLPGVQAAVSHQEAESLGLAPAREVLIRAPKISLDALRADISHALPPTRSVDVTRAVPFDQSRASTYALQAIPASYLDLYRRAAPTCPGLPWTVLAGIGTVETGNGANVARSVAGAEGPMQFEPSTWKVYGVDADGDGKADINDPVDAVFSAARYLCAAGASRGTAGIRDAIYAYNHAWWYVREVVTLANEYA
jgi:hypothetical protein